MWSVFYHYIDSEARQQLPSWPIHSTDANMMNITGVSEHIKLQRANMLTRPDASCLQAVKQLNTQTNSEQQQMILPAAAAAAA